MGKIIRNGIEFCGTADEAFNIIYNNADSGLAATTAQAAIDELNDKIKTGGGSNIRQLTQAEYDALSEEEKLNGTEYRITDANLEGTASNIVYDNAASGLQARNVQGAVDELKDDVDTLNESLNKCFLLSTATGFYADNANNVITVLPNALISTGLIKNNTKLTGGTKYTVTTNIGSIVNSLGKTINNNQKIIAGITHEGMFYIENDKTEITFMPHADMSQYNSIAYSIVIPLS